MRMFNRICKVTASLILLTLSATAHSDDSAVNTMNPYDMVEAVANNTFARFHQDVDIIKTDPDHLKLIVSDELMPYIDYKYASYKVMGIHLKATTKEQRTRFVKAFQGYLVATYAQAFTEYTDQQVKFAPAKDFTGEKMVDVNVELIEAGRPAIKLMFKVRRLKDGSWKAFDLVAEGVSLLASKSSEISNLIRQKGIDSVILELEQRNKGHISYKSNGTRL
ncbi:ABC-type transport system involved in resistance to organic solvents, auxiliary component [Shewanella psychrophila]|uniref:ABC-type transport system involved in resistance to organic solvents, auxiliary component n=2 Tax=Shewanella psychrophila TaxID=225848 RepID=A0A1S6HXG4_9GAMM|nr:ABC transporter substrate-binding protein [Shewanella psychrophila]AQS40267.1 ABC-type transport system involved in resistance to organic solvents, auxiliary component [Shewanella psychrophila]